MTTGSSGNNYLVGNNANNSIDGGAGNDTILGEGGNDTLIGGTGADTIYGGTGNDLIYGDTVSGSITTATPSSSHCGPDGSSSSNDVLYGGDGQDSIYGGLGDDHVYGDAGNDLLYGGAGNDTLYGGAGSDTVFGDAGNDVIYGGAAGASNDCGPGGNNGADGGDALYGGDGNDSIYGGDGNDTLVGGAGNNAEYGGNGDDTFVGGAGSDTFYGGTGQDNLDYSQSGAAVNVNLTTGTLSGGDAGNDHIGGGIDGVIGSNYGDSLVGFDQQGTSPSDTYTNQFYGMGGNDTIEGMGGNDLIYGGDGNDQIYGGGGNDTLYGDAGNDTISGGDGGDKMYGGTGSDLFNHVGAGDFVDGGEASPDNGAGDRDTLDLTGAGPFKIVYDSNNPENGTVNFIDPNDHSHITGSMTFHNIECVIPCFTPGTLIATPKGERPVEDLQPGDRVITRDNGIQEIRWVGQKALDYKALSASPHLKPILIQKGSLGNGLPERDMMVSPNHRVLVANERTALYFDEHEVLVSAKHLVNNRGVHEVACIGTAYIHFMFDNHEVVLSNGSWTESFQPGDYTLKGMGNAQRSEIFDLFPELKTEAGIEAYTAARKTLKRHEAVLLSK